MSKTIEITGWYICERIDPVHFKVYNDTFLDAQTASNNKNQYIGDEGFILQGVQLKFNGFPWEWAGKLPIEDRVIRNQVNSKEAASNINLNDMHKAWHGEDREEVKIARKRNQKKHF